MKSVKFLLLYNSNVSNGQPFIELVNSYYFVIK